MYDSGKLEVAIIYGRRTGQFKILPFDYLDTGRWFPGYSYEEQAIMYGVTGNVPESEWELMKEYAEAMGGFDKCYYYLFSKSGFTEGLKKYQNGVELRLITLEELYNEGVKIPFDAFIIIFGYLIYKC